MIHDRADAEAIYGSASRGDSDALSDRDILVVDSDVNVLRRRRQLLEQDGWSVATYTWKKLAHIAASQCLFIQHLKSESTILTDRRGRLESLLASFEPKGSYSKEIYANAELAEVTSVFPNTCRGHLWVADVLYVAMRNFGVLHLASKRQFVFGYAEILEALRIDGIISYCDVRGLLSLRELKNVYRDGCEFPTDIQARVRLAVRSIPKEVLTSGIHGVSAEHILNAWEAIPSCGATYLKVRNLEKLVIAACEIDPAISDDPEVLKLKRCIRDPRAYATLLVGKEESAHQVILTLTGVSACRRAGRRYPTCHPAPNLRRMRALRSAV